MADITYPPQFQPPAWKDNVDLMSAGGPNGFNIQFQNLRTEFDRLSSVVKQLSDLATSIGKTANTASTTASALSSKLQPAKWGLIDGTGKILSGSGDFTVSIKTTAVKTYYFEILFNPPFPDFPAVNTTVNWTNDFVTRIGGNTSANAMPVSIGQDRCWIYSGSVNGFSCNMAFSFIAYCSATGQKMADPQAITYQPQFKPPTWQDNVDLMLAGGPNGFNIQFQNLRTEFDRLSSVVKQLNDLANTISQTAKNANTTANAASTTASSKPQLTKWGQIGADGKILSGSGDFTVSTSSTYYEILFNSPFPSIPAVNATVNWNSTTTVDVDPLHQFSMYRNTTGNAVVLGANQNRCRIFTGLMNGMARPLSFSFLAYCSA